MSTIFVIGATGRVGQDLVADLSNNGHTVIAGSRHPEKIEERDNVHSIRFDLHASVDDMQNVLKSAGSIDAIYFVAGSRGKDLLQSDAFGAVKTMQAAQKLGIMRYVMLSSMYALQPEMWSKYPALAAITDYNIAKYFADNYLINNTKLDYTIVQPAVLTEEKPTGKISVGPGDETTNPIADVAQVLADVLNHPNTSRRVIMMRSGQTPISEALASVK